MSLLAARGTVVDGSYRALGAAVPVSSLRSIDPASRLVACCAFALVTVTLTRIPAQFAALLLSVIAAFSARLEPVPTLRRLASLDGFMLFALLFLPLTVPGTPMFEVIGFAASYEGLTQAVMIMLVSNAIVLMLLAMLGSMEPVALGHAMTRLRIPAKFVQLFLFTIRYIEVLGREYRTLRTAMRARAFRMGFGPHTWRSIGYLFGMLLVRSIERSERVLAAMRCRGFQGRFPSMAEHRPIAPGDRVFLALAFALCAGLVFMDAG